MKKEDAIKELELIAKVTIRNDRREAVEMAIKALSEQDDDSISRQDAIEAVGKYKEEHGYAYYDCACDIENDLKQLPSASAEADCSTCKHKDKDWDSEECDGCCGNNNHYESAEAVQGYTKWLEKIIVEVESFEWLCEDTNDKEWCEENCNYSSIQAECLRHLYEIRKGGEDE